MPGAVCTMMARGFLERFQLLALRTRHAIFFGVLTVGYSAIQYRDSPSCHEMKCSRVSLVT